mmetsp:Transcript_108163/g.304657  ORF Transcript_108163/g.304657 Transcript_108163/m.304657 type:complete len:220 (+) Transcript_108163:254-913(+)
MHRLLSASHCVSRAAATPSTTFGVGSGASIAGLGWATSPHVAVHKPQRCGSCGRSPQPAGAQNSALKSRSKKRTWVALLNSLRSASDHATANSACTGPSSITKAAALASLPRGTKKRGGFGGLGRHRTGSALAANTQGTDLNGNAMEANAEAAPGPQTTSAWQSPGHTAGSVSEPRSGGLNSRPLPTSSRMLPGGSLTWKTNSRTGLPSSSSSETGGSS